MCACPTEDTAGWKDSYDYNCTQYATGTAGTSWCLDSRYDSFHSRSNCVQVKKKMAEMRLALFVVVVRVYTVMVCLMCFMSLNDSNIEPPPPLPSSFLLSLSLFPLFLFQCCVEAGGTTGRLALSSDGAQLFVLSDSNQRINSYVEVSLDSYKECVRDDTVGWP